MPGERRCGEQRDRGCGGDGGEASLLREATAAAAPTAETVALAARTTPKRVPSRASAWNASATAAAAARPSGNCERERGKRAPGHRSPDGQFEQHQAAGDERSEEEQPPEHNRGGADGSVRGERRGWGRRGADREGEHALLEVTVVRDRAPAHAVVARRQVAAQRQLEHGAADRARPATTEPPPLRRAAFPGPAWTRSSKTTRTLPGEVASAARSGGIVCSRFACARAAAGTHSATAATRAVATRSGTP